MSELFRTRSTATGFLYLAFSLFSLFRLCRRRARTGEGEVSTERALNLDDEETFVRFAESRCFASFCLSIFCVLRGLDARAL